MIYYFVTYAVYKSSCQINSMDIQMPGMNGYDAPRAIQGLADAYASGILIIAMTANAFDLEMLPS